MEAYLQFNKKLENLAMFKANPVANIVSAPANFHDSLAMGSPFHTMLLRHNLCRASKLLSLHVKTW